jgi:tRNA (guanine26-N2/guanine27-N2)-dimethyltransferase
MEPETAVKPQGKPDIIQEGNLELIQEGLARIHTKYLNRNEQNQLVENEVFYNPIQVFNRDLTILVMQQYINNLQRERE